MAKYYKYGSHDVAKPEVNDDTVLSNFSDNSPPELTTEQMEKYHLGDILSFDNYRDVWTYIVGKDGVLVENPDFSGSGYLTIPVTVTQYLDNSFEHYKEHITDPDTCLVALELMPDDGWILARFGQSFPAEWKQIILWYSWGEFERLWIDFGNKCSQEFEANTPLKEIMQYYIDSQEVQSSFIGWYHIEGDVYDLVQEWEKEHKLELPVSWRSRTGGSCYGCRETSCSITFYGPKKYYKQALDAVRRYYFFYRIKIKEASQDGVMIQADGQVNVGIGHDKTIMEPCGFRESPLGTVSC